MAFFSPFRQSYADDPYPALHRLRREEPVHWSAELGAWVLTRYEDCLAVLTDDESFSSDPANAGGEFGAALAQRRLTVPLGQSPVMGNSDPPVHSALRAIVNRGFTPRIVQGMRASIETACAELLEGVSGAEPFEVIGGLAEPLAVSSVLKHLGVPQEGWAPFRACSLAIMRARAEGGSQPGVLEAAADARGQVLDYLAHVAEQRPADEPADILGVLLDACDEEAIDPDEMLMMLIHISLAGNAPTAMAIGNAAWVLAQHPDSQRVLIAHPDLVPAAVEEVLRFESSTHFVVRFAVRDTRIGARTIRAGQQVHAMVAAANRDPERFPDPDQFDIHRNENRHLSFGFGIHYCLGAPLARQELEIAVRSLLDRFGLFQQLDFARGGSYQVRGPQRLTISR
jgi:cytochrome P450